MINPTEVIEKTTTYIPPFIEDTLEYCNYEVYVITGSLENMYRYQYSRDYYGSTINPFKVRVLGLKRDVSTAKVWLTIDDPLRR